MTSIARNAKVLYNPAITNRQLHALSGTRDSVCMTNVMNTHPMARKEILRAFTG